MITVEEIHALYKQRRAAQGPLLDQMRKVRELANGDTIIPLNELDKSAKTSVANLLVTGLDQTSMRIASTSQPRTSHRLPKAKISPKN